MPISVGVAILRYRLYDIDRTINRTLVYGLHTAILGLVYAAAVLVGGQVFGGMAGDPPSWAVAGAALVVVALFQPVRPPHPRRGGSALQPSQVRRGQDGGGVQRPTA